MVERREGGSPHGEGVFDESGNLTDETTQALIRSLVVELVRWAGRLARE